MLEAGPGAESQILPSIYLVDCGDTLGPGRHYLSPQNLSRIFVVGSDRCVRDSAGKDQASSVVGIFTTAVVAALVAGVASQTVEASDKGAKPYTTWSNYEGSADSAQFLL
jgi:hypothetical protein